MKKIIVLAGFALMLGGCGEKSMLDSMTDASTIETLEACFTCAKGVKDKADGEAKINELSTLLKDFVVPEE